MVSEVSHSQLTECVRVSLNPCYSGRWSLSQNYVAFSIQRNGLNPCYSGRWSLRRGIVMAKYPILTGLNPCYRGRWSLRISGNYFRAIEHNVLILVIEEDGL